MILAIIGFSICIWAFGTGYGTSPNNRAAIFAGSVGTIVNGIVVLIGLGLIAWGIF
jgi:hypothetical protein